MEPCECMICDWTGAAEVPSHTTRGNTGTQEKRQRALPLFDGSKGGNIFEWVLEQTREARRNSAPYIPLYDRRPPSLGRRM
jgi:hypothetical protein